MIKLHGDRTSRHYQARRRKIEWTLQVYEKGSSPELSVKKKEHFESKSEVYNAGGLYSDQRNEYDIG